MESRHDSPQSADTEQPSSRTSDRVTLSWKPLLPIVPDIDIDKSDVHYRLYEDCLRYLQAEYPPSSISCLCLRLRSLLVSSPPNSLPGPFFKPVLCQQQPYIGALVNALTDIYPLTPPGSPDELLSILRQPPRSVLDFIIKAVMVMLYYRLPHMTCAVDRCIGDATESCRSRALFLDCITLLWSMESVTRAAARWSPMPWSQVSLREITAEPSIPTPVEAPLITEAEVLVEAEEAMLIAVTTGSPMSIPWLGAPHDGYPFCSTLSNYTRIRRHPTAQSLQDDAALWISALTFGLLEAVTQKRIPEAIFVIPGARKGKAVLSSARILQFFVHWYASHDEDTRDSEERKFDNATRLIDRALYALDEESDSSCPSGILARAGYARDGALEDIVCAVGALVMSLRATAVWKWKAKSNKEQLTDLIEDAPPIARTFYSAALRSCRRRMHRAGWCKNMISERFTTGLQGLHIALNLALLPPYIRTSIDEHSTCTESSCTIMSITDIGSYVVRHVDSSCHCAYVQPPLPDITRLLFKGIVPVVVYRGGKLQVLPADDNAYVAISHVWVDGMGSTTEEGLPTCVVERIARLARELLPQTGAFWLDSLCVPGGRMDSRKQAIKLMAQTYRDAAKVLVIDEGIRSLCGPGVTLRDALYRIGTSGWSRRVWTLQEGLLARELYFEFSHGPEDIEEALRIKEYRLSRSENIPSTSSTSDGIDMHAFDDTTTSNKPALFRSLFGSYVPLLDFRVKFWRISRVFRDIPLYEVIKLLAMRETSRAEDETIAISSLLPLNVEALLNISGPDAAQRRMQECLLQLGTIPRSLVMEMTPRLDLPGFSWAPRSLRTTLGASLCGDRVDGTGLCTEDGFLADFYVVSFEQPITVPRRGSNASPSQFRVSVFRRGQPFSKVYDIKITLTANYGASEPADGLLLLATTLPDSTIPAACVLVHGAGARSTKNTAQVVLGSENADQQLARRLRYIAPGSFELNPLLSVEMDKSGTPTMSYLSSGAAAQIKEMYQTRVQLV